MGEAEEQIKRIEEEIQENEDKKKFRETVLRSNKYFLVPAYAIIATASTYILSRSDLPPSAAAIAGAGFSAIPVLVWWEKTRDFRRGIQDLDIINEGNRYFIQYLRKDSRSYRN